jgi:hypothetical protein
MAVEHVDRLGIIVIGNRFLSMGAADSRSLRYGGYVRMKNNVRREFMQLGPSMFFQSAL